MDKRYQVFVSSTFADLQAERQAVIRTLMEMDCIPAGMELFPAADEEQLDFIKKVIDDCDYYILIIGGRYGSFGADGVSYTEKEYDYALSKGLKVLAFIHEAPEEIPLGKSEGDEAVRKKLEVFRTRVSTGRLVKSWKTSADLPGLVALSLQKTIKTYPATGWIRADRAAQEDVLSDVNNLRKEKEQLRARVAELESRPSPPIPDLAGLEETYEIRLEWAMGYMSDVERTTVSASWREIFTRIAPSLLVHPDDSEAERLLGRALLRKVRPNEVSEPTYMCVHADDFQTVRTQLLALDLIEMTPIQTVGGGRVLRWNLTDGGNRLMTEARTVRSGEPIEVTGPTDSHS